MKSKFEQHIKKSLDGYEAEYNPADWTDLQNRMNKASAGKSTGIGKGLLIAASVVVASGVIYYFSTTEKTITPAKNETDQVENVVPGKTVENTSVQTEAVVEKKNQHEPVSVKKENSEPAVEQNNAEQKQALADRSANQGSFRGR